MQEDTLQLRKWVKPPTFSSILMGGWSCFSPSQSLTLELPWNKDPHIEDILTSSPCLMKAIFSSAYIRWGMSSPWFSLHHVESLQWKLIPLFCTSSPYPESQARMVIKGLLLSPSRVLKECNWHNAIDCWISNWLVACFILLHELFLESHMLTNIKGFYFTWSYVFFIFNWHLTLAFSFLGINALGYQKFSYPLQESCEPKYQLI